MQPDLRPDRTIFHTLAEGIRGGAYSTKRLEVGTRIQHYEVKSQVGVGGMSVIYRAEHVYLGNSVAIKSVRPDVEHREVGERFLREASVLASMSHLGVVRVFDAGVHDGVPYIVTELLDGASVAERLRASGRMTVPQTFDLLEQIGRVLVRQEQLGVLHRDIKPSNIWIRDDGRYCLFDYGISDLDATRVPEPAGSTSYTTVVGQLVGTPHYMAPEQAQTPDRIDSRADLYALGLTVWECLTGEPARGTDSDNIGAVLARTLQPVPPVRSLRHEVPGEVETIVQGMLAVDRDDRYASAADMLSELEEYRYGGRRPHGATLGSVFVAIPFDTAFEPVYDAILQAGLDVRLSPRRIDRLVYVDDIWGQIVDEIETATAVVADFTRFGEETGPNANVITEAAHARAVGRPLVIITQDPPEQLPFDWRHVPVIRYSPTAGLADLQAALAPKLRHALSEAKTPSRGRRSTTVVSDDATPTPVVLDVPTIPPGPPTLP